MIRTLLCTTALLIAAPATAQQTAPGQAQPATGATPQQPAQGQSATPGATDVASIVDSEFPAYDTDSSGQLEQPEFAKWMIALKDEEMKASGKTLPASEVTAWASGAFATADADKSAAVSKSELVTYLSGGAG